MPTVLNDVGECVEAVLHRVGRRIVLALPLGIGKPNPVANEFYRRAQHDPSIELTILTALSLRKPAGSSDLERRFLEPMVQRVFGNYPELEYVGAMRANTVPANIRVIEFFLEPGAYVDSPHAQQNYLSANYTHVARVAMARGVNVIAHLVARRTVAGQTQLSLGSNPDVTVDLLPLIDQAKRSGRDVVMIGQVHPQMPFMLDRALISPERFDYLVDDARYHYDLYCPPNLPIGSVEHAIALHVSALVPDGGTVQIGIGELGDALVYALLLRHQKNAAYRQALKDLGTETFASILEAEGGREAFRTGLFASTEMFVDQILDLYRAGILRRPVYESLPVEKLLANGELDEPFDAAILERLLTAGLAPRVTAETFAELQECGVFRQDVQFQDGRIRTPGGEWIDADLSDEKVRGKLGSECLGRELQNGKVLHAGFFLGPRRFYAALRDLPETDRRKFAMRGVGYINQLYGEDQELRMLQRRQARFVNATMMVTLLGAAVSDGLEDGRVVSGVGGQYNFVSMAHALPDGRAILCVRASRTKDGRPISNLVWSYGHVTIPRHLRDIVVTEYGIADLRGRTDSEVIEALLNIADSRFQETLLAKAKAARKIRGDYRIPDTYRNNTPERLEQVLASHRRAGLFGEYPFGTDLTTEELVLAKALKHLKARTASRSAKLRMLAAAIARGGAADRHSSLLGRLGLDRPQRFHERLLRRLVVTALKETHPEDE
jgi:acyl-CoA hydrolase